MAYLGFNTLKNALCSLNVVYMMVGLLLIVVAAWGKGYGNVNSISIIGGVIAVGIFLLLISFIGLYGALKNHQVMLFFYMIILLLLFLIQFGVSCSCLALNRGQQEKLLATSWALMSSETRENLELHLNCCGFVNSTATSTEFNMDLNRCQAPCKIARNCFTCGDLILQHSSDVLKILGGLGLFFSFTDILGVWLAMRYRNMKDPRVNPSAFL